MTLNINTHILEYILEIKKSGSISKAAQNLFISQPNLSTAIKVLEEQLGFQIFERSTKGIITTKEGALFIKSAENIISELENILNIPSQCASSEPNSISVVCVYSPLLLELFMQFISEINVKLSNNAFKETGLNHAMDDIISKTYHLGFFYDFDCNHHKRIKLAEKYSLEIKMLYPNIQVMAYLRNDHILAGKKEININELKNYPLVTYEDFSYEDWLGTIGIERSSHDILYIFDRGGMKESIIRNNNIGISVGDSFSKKHEKDISQIPIKGISCVLNQYLIKSKNYKLNNIESDFISYIQNKLEFYLK